MSKKQAYLLFVVLFGVFMGGLDMSIVSPTLLSLQADFGVAERWLTWALTVYSLVYIISMPIVAKLSERLGRKWTYMGAVALFGVGSLVCGVAPNFGVFLLGRAIQAIGGGGIFPLATAEIGDAFPPKQRGMALGMLGGVVGVAAVVGPNLGGFLIENFDWHYVFFINLPISVLIIVLAYFLEARERPEEPSPFDAAGAVLLSLALFMLMFGLSQINSSDLLRSIFVGVPPDLAEGETANVLDQLGSIPIIIYIAIALGLLAVFWWVERRVSDPMLPLGLLKQRQLALANGISFFGGIAMSSIFFVPALGATLLGLGEQESGSIVTPVAVTMFFAAPGLGALLTLLGSRLIIGVGTLIASLGMFLLGTWAHDLPTFIVSLVPVGIGLGALVGSPLNYIAVNNAPSRLRAAGISVLTIFRNIGIVMGPTLAGALLASNASASMGPAMNAAMEFDTAIMREMMRMETMMPMMNEAMAEGDISQEAGAQIGMAMMDGAFSMDRLDDLPEAARDAMDTLNARYLMPKIAEAAGEGTMPYYTMQALEEDLIAEEDVARIAAVMMGGAFSMDRMDALPEETREAMDLVVETYIANPVMAQGFRQVYQFMGGAVLGAVVLAVFLRGQEAERTHIAEMEDAQPMPAGAA